MPAAVSKRARAAPAIDARRIRVAADVMLGALGLGRAELSVLLADDATLWRLNREHRAKDRPTDVLAFPLDERDAVRAHRAASGGEGLVLGDVVISLHTALRQARARRRPLFDEVRFLLAHGLLHLVGYDHATPTQKKRMVAMTRRLVSAAGTKPSGHPRRRRATSPDRRRKTRRR